MIRFIKKLAIGLIISLMILGVTTSFTQAQSLSTYDFSKTLKYGVSGPDVKQLQKILNSNPLTQISTTGLGSPGLETSYFGTKTKVATQKWQQLNNLPVDGIVGSKSIAILEVTTLPITSPSTNNSVVDINTTSKVATLPIEVPTPITTDPTSSTLTEGLTALSNTGMPSIVSLSSITSILGINAISEALTVLSTDTSFSVNSSLTECLPETSPFIEIISPNGGEIFNHSSNVTVRWVTCNYNSPTVNIVLTYNANSTLEPNNITKACTLALDTPNDGTEIVNFNQPCDCLGDFNNPDNVMQPGNNYKMYVTSGGTYPSASFSDKSDNLFTIDNNLTLEEKDLILKQQITEFEQILALEHAQTGSYCNLVPDSYYDLPPLNCDQAGIFLGNYSIQAKAICHIIWENVKKVGQGVSIYLSSDYYHYDCQNKYSIAVWLNNGNWYCKSKDKTSETFSADYDWDQPGCMGNP
ncbi:MAG: peptidoglycan-binding domain-containing protein [Candidatus Paceibacterota bacterium]